MVMVSGMTNLEISDQVITNQDKIVKSFKIQELQEKQRRTKKSLFNSTAITKQFGINIQLPSVYRHSQNNPMIFSGYVEILKQER